MEPSVKVLVSVARLEYDTVVSHGGNVIVVVLVSGMGGHTSVTPGRAVTMGVAESQMSGLM